MRWAGSSVVDVYLGTRAVALCRASDLLWSGAAQGLTEALVALRGQLAACETKTKLRIWLSGGLCRPFIVPAMAGVRDAGERRRVAHAMAGSLEGLGADCQVWIEPARPGAHAVAVCMLDSTFGAVQDLLDERKLTPLSIRPWWAEVLRHALHKQPSLRALSVRDCDSMTFLAGAGDGFDQAITHSPVNDEAAGAAALARSLLAADLDAASMVSAKLLTASPARVPSEVGVALAPMLEMAS